MLRAIPVIVSNKLYFINKKKNGDDDHVKTVWQSLNKKQKNSSIQTTEKKR